MFRVLVIYILSTLLCQAQQSKINHIEVAILGTFHIGESTDYLDAGVDDILSRKRQREVRAMVKKLAAFQPDKIFVENTPAAQRVWDEVYKDYRNKKYPSSPQIVKNEIYQLGIKTAAELDLNRGVYCINYNHSEGEEARGNTIEQYWADFSKEVGRNKPSVGMHLNSVGIAAESFKSVSQKHESWKRFSLKEHLIQMNKEASLRELQYVNTLTWMDNNAENIGAEITTREYYRNFKIIQNLISHLRSTDHKILIIYGAGHAKIFRDILESHPVFEIVEVEKILR
ncbi:DUF5694 domain-containing protein [Jiulongibacter sp. NS-SX5]|uniref:DUF5694 domain-containing protein n=1 Tax=Jiulongibacter sp. NS-SX5 TaxID=3463854 RepID=UPI004058AB5D